MRLSILSVAALLLLTVQILANPTVLTYIIEHQIDQPDTYVELTLKVQSEGKSLSDCINDAERIVLKIQQLATDHCLQKFKNKQDCEQIVDASNFEVQPKYHLVRKVETFTLFILSREVTVNIKNLVGLGRLADQIINQGEGLVTLGDFVWKAADELDPEKQTIREGIQQGKQLCEKFNKELSEFISLEELELPVQEGEEEEDERDPDLAEIDIQKTIFKFKVRCTDSKKSKTK